MVGFDHGPGRLSATAVLVEASMLPFKLVKGPESRDVMLMLSGALVLKCGTLGWPSLIRFNLRRPFYCNGRCLESYPPPLVCLPLVHKQ
eukprot:scaffold10892_cov23-Tisochrysis_lutea.AAC.5